MKFDLGNDKTYKDMIPVIGEEFAYIARRDGIVLDRDDTVYFRDVVWRDPAAQYVFKTLPRPLPSMHPHDFCKFWAFRHALCTNYTIQPRCPNNVCRVMRGVINDATKNIAGCLAKGNRPGEREDRMTQSLIEQMRQVFIDNRFTELRNAQR